jgi:hypothetical protein
MNSNGEWSIGEIAGLPKRTSWDGLTAKVPNGFTGGVPFELVDKVGRVRSFSMRVERGTAVDFVRSETMDSAIVSYGPPLLGPSQLPSRIRVGAVTHRMPPFDEARYQGWSWPSLVRGGSIVICQAITDSIDGDTTAWFLIEDGRLVGVYNDAPAGGHRAGVPFMKIRTSWSTRLRWRMGEITTLEMAAGTAIRAGAWSTLDFALATADRAQVEMMNDSLPLAEELLWLAAALVGARHDDGYSISRSTESLSGDPRGTTHE